MKPKKKEKPNEEALPEFTMEMAILNKLGVHARPAAAFVKTASRFKSVIFAEKDGEMVNAKSIMGLMMMAAGPGAKVIIRARGPDAEEALRALDELVRRKFDE